MAIPVAGEFNALTYPALRAMHRIDAVPPSSSPPGLAALLQKGEWMTTEFKAAREGLPKSVFETLAAFANTEGGWLVLGVSQQGEHIEIVGVSEPDKLQSDLLSVLHADGKVNHDIQLTAHRYQQDGKILHFRAHSLQKAIALGLIEMTLPEKPRSRLQRYRLTAAGQRLLQANSNPPSTSGGRHNA